MGLRTMGPYTVPEQKKLTALVTSVNSPGEAQSSVEHPNMLDGYRIFYSESSKLE